jgi:hypothetical protein
MPARTEIRTALETIYEELSGIATVYIGRRRSIPAAALPAVCIYIDEEEKELSSTGKPRVFQREMSLVSEIHVNAANAQEAEELLDTLAAAREAAILADETLGGLVEYILPKADVYDIDEEGQRPAAVAACTDAVLYVD